MSDLSISEQELLSQKLSKEIDDKKILRGNLETQIIALERQKKSEKDVTDVQAQAVRNQALRDLADAKEGAMKEKSEYNRKIVVLAEQKDVFEKNKKEVGDIKGKLAELQNERIEIYDLRKSADELTRQAKIQWGKIEGFKESQEALQQDLESQIKLNKKTYKEYMDLVGGLEVKEKALKIRESNCRALEMVHDKKEVYSGK